ncbi:MAG: hypothetical protein ABJZ55_09940 [Fuerstiella sp.]
MMVSSFGVIELLLIISSFGGPFSQVLGLPPGDRDPNLSFAAVENSVVYVEWAARGAGSADAPGIDGMAADPEVQQFFTRLQAAIEKMIMQEMGDETARLLPEFVLSLSGRPGCVFLGLDTTSEPAADVPPPLAVLNAVRGAVVVNGGDDTDAIVEKMKVILKAGTGIDFQQLDHTALPIPAPLPVTLHRHGNYIILGIGSDVVDQVVGRLSTQSGGLANHAGYQEAWGKLGLERTGLITFLDIKNGASAIAEPLGVAPVVQMGLQMAGLTGVKWTMNVTGVVDGQCVSRGMVSGVDGDAGLMALVAGRGIRSDDFAMVPADSDLVFAVSADVPKVIAEVKTFLSGVNPRAVEDVEQGLSEAGEFLGMDILKEVVPSFGQVVTVSNSPGDGGWIANSMVLTIEVKDEAGATKVMKQIADLIDREANHGDASSRRRRGVVLERRQLMGTDIFMINTIGNDDIPIAPTWCLTDSHVLVALHPQAIKSRLRRTQDSSWQSYGESMAAAPAGETIVFSAMKMKSVLPQIYGFVPWVGQILFSEMQSEGFDMNLFDFPSAQAILPYMSDAKSFVVRTPNGVQTYCEGPPVLSNLPTLVPSFLPVLTFGLANKRSARMDVIAP